MSQFVTYKHNAPINLDLVTRFTQGIWHTPNKITKHIIRFSQPNDEQVAWTFDSKDERDNVYEFIIELCCNDIELGVLRTFPN